MVSIKCLVGFHDWEQLEPTEEEVERYTKFYVHPAPDGFSYFVNAPNIRKAPRDRACLRCFKKEARFQQLLIRGVKVYEEEMLFRMLQRTAENQEKITKSLRQLQAVQLLREPNESKSKQGQAAAKSG
jgi:hypothetical protein